MTPFAIHSRLGRGGSRSTDRPRVPAPVRPVRAAIRLAARIGTRIAAGIAARIARVRCRPEAGMNTAEYAVGTLAAVAFAGALLKVLTSDAVRSALTSLIARALQ
jgi:hypothetical protein